MATGQALYALDALGAPREPIEAGQRFLLGSQNENGGWIVPSTLARKHGEAIPTSNFWGTAWAVIGLAHSAPAQARAGL